MIDCLRRCRMCAFGHRVRKSATSIVAAHQMCTPPWPSRHPYFAEVGAMRFVRPRSAHL